jgi:hypothetical protein
MQKVEHKVRHKLNNWQYSCRTKGFNIADNHHRRDVELCCFSHVSCSLLLLADTGFQGSEWSLPGNLPISPNSTSLYTLTLKMETACSVGTLIFSNKTIWFHNPDDHNLNSHCYENLKTYMLLDLFCCRWFSLEFLKERVSLASQLVNGILTMVVHSL